MAKKQKKGEVEEDIYNISSSVNSMLHQYKKIPKKDRAKILKQYNKDRKGLLNQFEKTGSTNFFQLKGLENKIKKLEGLSDRIDINYGIFDFKVKTTYLEGIKDKEKYLDGLFNRKMKGYLSKIESPKNDREAKELQALVTQYAKKIEKRDFFDKGLTQSVINKLNKYRKSLTLFEPTDYIGNLEKRLQGLDEGEEIEQDEIYEIIEKPILVDGYLVGLQFNFF